MEANGSDAEELKKKLEFQNRLVEESEEVLRF